MPFRQEKAKLASTISTFHHIEINNRKHANQSAQPTQGLFPEVPVSEGPKSPVPMANPLVGNNFFTSKNAERSIYNVFRRSKHKLFEPEKSPLKPSGQSKFKV